MYIEEDTRLDLILNRTTDEEKMFLWLRHVEKYTPLEIGDMFGTSSAHVRNILADAKKKLRHFDSE